MLAHSVSHHVINVAVFLLLLVTTPSLQTLSHSVPSFVQFGFAEGIDSSNSSGSFSNEIVFGQSAAFTGLSVALGQRMRAGVLAAFKQINANGGIIGGGGAATSLRLITYDDGYDPQPCLENTNRLVYNDSVFGLIGYVGTPTSAAATPVAIANKIPFIGAFTGTAALRSPFNQYLVNVRSSYDDEMAAEAVLLVGRFHVKRIACFYQDDAFGLAGYKGIVRALSAMDMKLVAEGRYVRNTLDVEVGLRAILGSGARPQAVVMVGTYSALAKFVRKAKRDSRIDPDCIFTTLSFVGTEPFRDALGGGSDWQNVYISEVVPLPSATEYILVQNYLEALTALEGTASAGNSVGDGDTISLEGYIVGRLAAQALARIPVMSREAFLETIYNTKMFQIDDLLLGPYSGECFGQLDTVCSCSQGMKQVWMAQINATGHLINVPDFKFVYPLTECQSSTGVVKAPALFLQLIPEETGPARTIGLQKELGIRQAFAAVNAAGGFANGRQLSLVTHTYKSNEYNATLYQLMDRYPIVALLGSVDIPTPTGADDIPAIGTHRTRVPVVPKIKLENPVGGASGGEASVFNEREILTEAPLESEIMALVAMASAEGVSRISALIVQSQDTSAGDSEAIVTALSNSLITYSMRLGTVTIATQRTAADLAPPLPSNEWVLVVDDPTASMMNQWLEQMKDLPRTHMLLTSRTTNHIDLVGVRSFNEGTVAARIHFASPMPFWDGSSQFTLQYQTDAEAYAKAMAASTHGGQTPRDPTAPPTPATLQGFAEGKAVFDVLTRSGQGASTTPQHLLNTWYATRLIANLDVQLGRYSRCETSALSNRRGEAESEATKQLQLQQQQQQCGCNSGVRRLCVYTVGERNSSTMCYDLIGCRVLYVFPAVIADRGLSKGAIAGIVVGVAAAVIALLAVSIWVSRSDVRNNRNAPKDPSKPFCILFTDIQSSTALWAAMPTEMADALDMHHAIIRELIAKYKGYEVKTNGDSFMIAFHDPDHAVRLALDIQTRFFAQDWKTSEIDTSYVTFIEDARYNSPVPNLFPATLPPEEYAKLWNGLRVRVGIHYGMGEIKLDEVSKGYDYYGTVVNVAARIETVAHGGQIAVSSDVYETLPQSFREENVWKSLGPVPLRGLSDPVPLYQLLPKAFARRTFPPLRLDDPYEEDDDKANTSPTGGSGRVSDHSSLSESSLGVGVATNTTAQFDDQPTSAVYFAHHKLVLSRVATAKEVHAHYWSSLYSLKAVVGPLPLKQRDVFLKNVCDRLKINTSSSGTGGGGGNAATKLDRTLHTIIMRVLSSGFQQSKRLQQSQPQAAALSTGGVAPPVASGVVMTGASQMAHSNSTSINNFLQQQYDQSMHIFAGSGSCSPDMTRGSGVFARGPSEGFHPISGGNVCHVPGNLTSLTNNNASASLFVAVNEKSTSFSAVGETSKNQGQNSPSAMFLSTTHHALAHETPLGSVSPADFPGKGVA